MKIPQDMADFIEDYINNHKELGFKFVSQYIVHVLQDHIRNLSTFYPIKERVEKSVSLKEGIYTKEEIKKILEDMKE